MFYLILPNLLLPARVFCGKPVPNRAL